MECAAPRTVSVGRRVRINALTVTDYEALFLLIAKTTK